MGIKIAIKVAYFNTLENTHGFQIQPELDTIQSFLLKAILKSKLVVDKRFKLEYAGRTDHGVNALSQVISFKLADKYYNIPDRMLFQINNFLPKNIRCWAYTQVSDEFHPRFHAFERTYSYVWYEPNIEALDLNRMKISSQQLIGEHNFTNFSKKDENQKRTTRLLSAIQIEKNNSVVIFKLTGQSFLWQQCRRIASHLLQIGKSEVKPDETIRLLSDFSNLKSPSPLPPEFLILTNIKYPNLSFLVEKAIIKKIMVNLDTILNNKINQISIIQNYSSLFSKSIANN